MKGFVRMTKLSNIGGRADYITDPKRQECVVAESEHMDWEPYQRYEQNNPKCGVKNNDGRELIIALPNEWAELGRYELENRVQHIAETAIGKDTDMQWAVHWNKDHTNLHVHVIFSERQKEKEPKYWDRDVYLTNDGKVARRKADRATFPDGEVMPPIHRKGDVKDGFTAKNPEYAKRSWLRDTKTALEQVLTLYGANIERQEPLHQYHEGKGRDSAEIRQKNELVKQNNAVILKLSEELPEFPIERLKQMALDCLKDSQVLHGEMLVEELEQYGYERNALTTFQKRPESILERFSGETVEMSQKRLEPKSGMILGAVKAMENSLHDYLTDLRALNQCKFYEWSKKKDLRQKVDAHVEDYGNSLAVLKAHGVNVDRYDLYRVSGDVALIDKLKEQVGIAPKDATRPPQRQNNGQMTMDTIHGKIEAFKEQSAPSRQQSRTKSRSDDRDDR